MVKKVVCKKKNRFWRKNFIKTRDFSRKSGPVNRRKQKTQRSSKMNDCEDALAKEDVVVSERDLMLMKDLDKAREQIYKKHEFDLEHEIETEANALSEDLFKADRALDNELAQTKPWQQDPKFFVDVKVSALALIKIALHARSGGDLEVMGVLKGKVLDRTIVVVDCFQLPVEGTETRVNAQAEGYEYMVEFNESMRKVGREEHVVGWYHSHPGYGCWMSGIDVRTQQLNQKYTEPYLGIVCDPVRSQQSGRVEIGAFRTFPEGYVQPTNEQQNRSEVGGGGDVPSAKIEDYGVHKDKYYELPISIFKSTLDGQILKRLWDEYWASNFTQMPLSMTSGAKDFVNETVKDVAQKMSNIDASRGFLADDETATQVFSSLKKGTTMLDDDVEDNNNDNINDMDDNDNNNNNNEGLYAASLKEAISTQMTREPKSSTKARSSSRRGGGSSQQDVGYSYHNDFDLKSSARALKSIGGGQESEKLLLAAREAERVAAEHMKHSISRELNQKLFYGSSSSKKLVDTHMDG